MSLAGVVVKETGKFWEVQQELVVALNMLGVRCDIKDRLEPLKLLRLLEKLREPDLDTLGLARRLITFLVQLRRLGYEPSHKNNKYV